MIIITNNEAETVCEGEKLGRTLAPGTIVALYGDLGAGKTAFTRGLAAGLGIHMSVSSPTFTIVNEYAGDIPLFHFDMYRLKNENELFDIGWDDYLDRGGVCAVEWSEKVPGAFSADTISVKIKSLGGDMRRLEIINAAGGGFGSLHEKGTSGCGYGSLHEKETAGCRFGSLHKEETIGNGFSLHDEKDGALC